MATSLTARWRYDRPVRAGSDGGNGDSTSWDAPTTRSAPCCSPLRDGAQPRAAADAVGDGQGRARGARRRGGDPALGAEPAHFPVDLAPSAWTTRVSLLRGGPPYGLIEARCSATTCPTRSGLAASQASCDPCGGGGAAAAHAAHHGPRLARRRRRPSSARAGAGLRAGDVGGRCPYAAIDPARRRAGVEDGTIVRTWPTRGRSNLVRPRTPAVCAALGRANPARWPGTDGRMHQLSSKRPIAAPGAHGPALPTGCAARPCPAREVMELLEPDWISSHRSAAGAETARLTVAGRDSPGGCVCLSAVRRATPDLLLLDEWDLCPDSSRGVETGLAGVWRGRYIRQPRPRA
jgi:hypothetical protein